MILKIYNFKNEYLSVFNFQDEGSAQERNLLLRSSFFATNTNVTLLDLKRPNVSLYAAFYGCLLSFHFSNIIKI